MSKSYLSTLESGNNENITLPVLQRLQEQFGFFHLAEPLQNSEFTERYEKALQQIALLEKMDKESANFIIHNLESNIQWFIDKKK